MLEGPEAGSVHVTNGDPDADPGGPKTYGSYGSGSPTLHKIFGGSYPGQFFSKQADNKKSPPKNLMRLFLDESQSDALEVRAALVSVRQAQQLNTVLLIQLGDQPRLTHLLQSLKTKTM